MLLPGRAVWKNGSGEVDGEEGWWTNVPNNEVLEEVWSAGETVKGGAGPKFE